MNKVFAVIFIAFSINSYGQEKRKKVSLEEIFNQAIITQPDSIIYFENLEITWNANGPSLNDRLKVSFPNTLLDSGRIVIHNRITFSDCQFNGFPSFDICFANKVRIFGSEGDISFWESKVNTLQILDFKGDVRISYSKVERLFNSSTRLFISYSNIGSARLVAEISESIQLENSIFQSNAEYYLNGSPLFNEPIKSETYEDSISQVLHSKVIYKDFKSLEVSLSERSHLRIDRCQFLATNKNGSVELNGGFENLEILNSYFSNPLVFNSCTIGRSITLRGNKFVEGLSVKDLEFPVSRTFMNWDEFDGHKLFVPVSFKDTINSLNHMIYHSQAGAYMRHEYIQLYKAQSVDEISKLFDYEDLIDSYQKVYIIFKQRGDTESSNHCYAEMKDIQTGRLKHLYNQNPSFNTYFRWRLSSLMKFYTNHGTDPARAITVSVWVIIFFGFFYFFFPSDWDVTSKSDLLKRYKTFIQKNEHGYFKPFLSLCAGFFLSLLNALTLSLNSFTTLGFGNIPTHGIARYVCVIQGFIGWFLLSIFTVALINQVLG